MYLPIMAAEPKTVCVLLLCWSVLCKLWVASSALNCAICDIICVLSIGCMGSWFCICASNSLKKSC